MQVGPRIPAGLQLQKAEVAQLLGQRGVLLTCRAMLTGNVLKKNASAARTGVTHGRQSHPGAACSILIATLLQTVRRNARTIGFAARDSLECERRRSGASSWAAGQRTAAQYAVHEPGYAAEIPAAEKVEADHDPRRRA